MIDPTPLRRMPHYDASELPPIPAENLGRLSAEAVQAQYETAAKSVEAMGDEVRVRIGKLEAALAECDADMRLIAEGANAIREKLVSLQIEEASIQCKDIRDICDALKANSGREARYCQSLESVARGPEGVGRGLVILPSRNRNHGYRDKSKVSRLIWNVLSVNSDRDVCHSQLRQSSLLQSAISPLDSRATIVPTWLQRRNNRGEQPAHKDDKPASPRIKVDTRSLRYRCRLRDQHQARFSHKGRDRRWAYVQTS
jgi:predicted Zn-ribbon and HTH transcriptional regulator